MWDAQERDLGPFKVRITETFPLGTGVVSRSRRLSWTSCQVIREPVV